MGYVFFVKKTFFNIYFIFAILLDFLPQFC